MLQTSFLSPLEHFMHSLLSIECLMWFSIAIISVQRTCILMYVCRVLLVLLVGMAQMVTMELKGNQVFKDLKEREDKWVVWASRE